MTYTEELVEHLLPTLWDQSFVLGIDNPNAPDPDMPKAKYKNPKQSTDFWCHLIDIRRAWDNAPALRWDYMRALFMYFGLGWTQDEIAHHEQVSKKTINKRLKYGVEALVLYLN